MSNVVEIQQAVKKETIKKEKLTSGDIETHMRHFLNKDRNVNMTGDDENRSKKLSSLLGIGFDRDFRSYKTSIASKSGRILFEIKNNTAYEISVEEMAQILSSYLYDLPRHLNCYRLDYERCVKIIKTWAISHNDVRDLPNIYGYKSDKDLVRCRLDYDKVDMFDSNLLDILCPQYAEFRTRWSAPEDTDAFLGSILDLKSDRKQILWCYGESNGGKSQIENLVKKLVGENNVKTITPKGLKDNFCGVIFSRSRVVIINEADAKFIGSEDFKAITGDDEMMVREIYQQPNWLKLNCKIICLSNNKPIVPDDPAFKNRMIINKIDEIPFEKRKSKHEVMENWTKEVPSIAGYVTKSYQDMCPGHKTIPHDIKTHLQPIIDEANADYLNFCEKYFEIGDEKNDWVETLKVNKMVEALRWNRKDYSIIKSILTNKMRLVCERAPGKSRPHAYKGIKLTPAGRNLLNLV
jgi:hypothetical protein